LLCGVEVTGASSADHHEISDAGNPDEPAHFGGVYISEGLKEDYSRGGATAQRKRSAVAPLRE